MVCFAGLLRGGCVGGRVVVVDANADAVWFLGPEGTVSSRCLTQIPHMNLWGRARLMYAMLSCLPVHEE